MGVLWGGGKGGEKSKILNLKKIKIKMNTNEGKALNWYTLFTPIFQVWKRIFSSSNTKKYP